MMPRGRRAMTMEAGGGVLPRVPAVAAPVILGLIALVGFQASLGLAWLLPGLGGLAIGTGVALVGARRGAPLLIVVGAAVVAYLVLGTALAVPSLGLFGVIPMPRSLAALLVGPVQGWADIVTLAAPVTAPDHVRVVPYCAGWLVGLVSTLIATGPVAVRDAPWRRALLIVPSLALYTATVLAGTAAPVLPEVRGVAFALVALAIEAWRQGPRGPHRVGGGRLASALALLAGALVVGLGASAAVAQAPARFVLRDHVLPPFEPAQYASPLSGFRTYIKVAPDKLLFTIDGLRPGEVVRLATMDTFTGKLWNVAGHEIATDGSGSYVLAGTDLPLPEFLAEGRTGTFSVTVDEYADVWMPTVGYPTSIRLGGAAAGDIGDLRFNSTSGSLVLTTGLAPGDSYQFTATLQQLATADEFTEAIAAVVEQPPAQRVPGILLSKAQQFTADATTDAEKLVALESALRAGYLSHGLLSDSGSSLAGHGADRLTALFEANYLVGDEEQYASAFALMARELGFATRVVMGFAPEVAEGIGSVEVHGSDVTAWPEVAIVGVGWVAFSPTPDNTDVPTDLAELPQSKPQPQVRQPPRSLADENDVLSDVEIAEPPPTPDPFPWWIVVLIASILAGLAVLASPVLAIRALKRRRAHRREHTGRPDQRVAGAWDELMDRTVELGGPAASPIQVRTEQGPAHVALAKRIDCLVFDGRPIAEADVEKVWKRVREMIAADHRDAAPSARRLSAVRLRWRRRPDLAKLTSRLRSDLIRTGGAR